MAVQTLQPEVERIVAQAQGFLQEHDHLREVIGRFNDLDAQHALISGVVVSFLKPRHNNDIDLIVDDDGLRRYAAEYGPAIDDKAWVTAHEAGSIPVHMAINELPIPGGDIPINCSSRGNVIRAGRTYQFELTERMADATWPVVVDGVEMRVANLGDVALHKAILQRRTGSKDDIDDLETLARTGLINPDYVTSRFDEVGADDRVISALHESGVLPGTPPLDAQRSPVNFYY